MGIGGQKEKRQSSTIIPKRQNYIVIGFMMYLKAGLCPKKGISATEAAKECRRMAGFRNINRSLINRIRKG